MLEKNFTEDEYSKLKSSNDLLLKTLELVIKLFEGKTDKAGLPYYNHLLKVYANVDNYDEKIIALLHDVVEDTEVTFDDLKVYGYPENILEALRVLTKKKGEYYPDYIERIIDSNNIQALNVKLADLKHNVDINRIENPTINDYERINKRYIPAINKIQNKLEQIKESKIC
ncbi:MAG: GTP pyrophosphokinase [Erysipelotrichaceae bacterium]|nr:GTP pyrophosphokinase [Erysipelotrichaceae bacterium]